MARRFRGAPIGKFVAREITIGEFTPLTGFVDDYGGNPVKLALNPQGKRENILCRPTISFSPFVAPRNRWQGGLCGGDGAIGHCRAVGCASSGSAGYGPGMNERLSAARGEPAFIRPRASGSILLTVNLEAIRDIPVAFSYRRVTDETNQEYRKISESTVRVTQLRRES